MNTSWLAQKLISHVAIRDGFRTFQNVSKIRALTLEIFKQVSVIRITLHITFHKLSPINSDSFLQFHFAEGTLISTIEFLENMNIHSEITGNNLLTSSVYGISVSSDQKTEKPEEKTVLRWLLVGVRISTISMIVIVFAIVRYMY